MNIFSDRIKKLRPSAIREVFKVISDPSIISFAAGNPALEAFPCDAVKKISAEILAEEPVNALQYSITEGYAPLRDWLKKDLTKKKCFSEENDDIIITAGAQQAIDLLTKIICNEGDAIICENPSFVGSLNTFRSYGAKLIGVSMDDEGIEPNRLEDALKKYQKAAFLYLIPNFQNPTGKTMSLQRRKDVLQLAQRYNLLVLEDNPYGDLRFAGKDIPSLKELDEMRGGNCQSKILYVGTFSKTLAPGLRVGFLCAPDYIAQKAVMALQTSTVHTNIWAQTLTYRFVTQTDFNAHLEKIRLIYKNKRKLMLDNLKFYMPLSINFTEPEGGFFLWGTLPEKDSFDAQDFTRKALENKVAIVSENAFSVKELNACSSFRLNYSSPTDDQIIKGVGILSSVAKNFYI